MQPDKRTGLLAQPVQVRAADWHGDIPLIVLTRGRRRSPGDYRVPSLAPRFQQLHVELQRDLARRSTKGRHVVAEKSGHYIHRDQPELVVEAIGQVLGRAKDPRRGEYEVVRPGKSPPSR